MAKYNEKNNKKGGRDGGGRRGDDIKNKKIRREPKIDLSRFAGSSEEEDNAEIIHTKPRNPKRVKKQVAKHKLAAENTERGRVKKARNDNTAQTSKKDDGADDETLNSKTISFLKSEKSNPSSMTEKKEETSKKKKQQIGGVGVKDISIGQGSEVKKGARVSITYTGSFPSRYGKKGKIFDKNLNPNQPLRFVLGAGEVVPGLEIGMKGMKVGGERIITIPSALGYGSEGDPPDIPGGATLQFEVKLVKTGKGGGTRDF